MNTVVTPYKNSESGKKEQVAQMFNAIAPRYDFLNNLLSLGIHVLWRRKAIRLLKNNSPKKILDIATGTADFAIEAMKLHPEKVIGIDISESMLKIGKEKILKKKLSSIIELQTGDSENLTFADNSFDAITVGFGVRNFENLEKGLGEIHRVLANDGMLVILEFSKPTSFPVKQLYEFYFLKICPLLGKYFSKDKAAYNYLPESVNAFPAGNDFLKIMQKTGFKNTLCYPLSKGIASIYVGKK
ncbi:MAG TPA: bifunctional demethylmenaquinone methyltransferase/2-methoxy-6-polyprenyl-1,4-benzoquinol methylase UbiE [Bacteroidia bacterium]|nr:bifunctional demethylmenaquinone methyltransferase/2-methoxy-6-polyprenyl-1,4-benzoquinol methylase UbiE [Bacteroidia bacterium]